MDLLYKNHLINNRKADEIATIALDKLSLEYEYQYSQAKFKNRGSVSKSYINKTTNAVLIPFNHKGVRFNMISCPAGGKVKIDKTEWKTQKIKNPFMLGETEVTQELFESVMGFNYSLNKTSNKNAISGVSLFDCIEFCNKLSDFLELERCYTLREKRMEPFNMPPSYTEDRPLSIKFAIIDTTEGKNGFRLPKEWEWQIAAMAGTNNLYAGANDNKSLKRFAWFDENSDKKTHPVAQKLPNEWGFYDMSGNVYEWCENSYEPDESSDEPGENDDPLANRVGRGGDSGDNAMNLPSQMNNPPNTRSDILGFRVARSM